MNGRAAKRLRRENPKKEAPELYMSYGPNRARRRNVRFKVKERSFTRTGEQYKVFDTDGTFEWRKARHVVNDYRYQREANDGR